MDNFVCEWQQYHCIIVLYFCILYYHFHFDIFVLIIDLMLKGKSLLDNTNVFCPNEYEKDDKIILKYFH